MKKISILLACAAVLGFTSCDSTDDPKLSIPEDHSFVLNAPAFADQYYELQEGNSFMLTCSQPAYGVAVAAQYSVEVALDDKFTAVETLKPAEPGSAKIVIADEALATALCNLHGFDAANYEDLPASPVYFRAFCEIPGIEGTRCMSNTVSLNKVKFYHAVQGQRSIYLVGSVEGWSGPDAANAAHYENWKLIETAIGSDVYTGSFTFPKGEVAFRFYSALTGWDGGASIGSQEPDEGLSIEGKFVDNIYEGPAVIPGKGNWTFTMTEEMNVNLTVDVKNKTVKFELGGDVNYDAYPCVYVVGNVEGWKGPDEANAEHYADWRLFDTDGTGIYHSVKPMEYDIADGACPMFRIYTKLEGWDANSLGSQVDDNAKDETGLDLTLNYVEGKGSWNFVSAPAKGSMELVLDTNKKTLEVKFSAAE